MKLLERIQLTLHAAAEVAPKSAQREQTAQHRLPETVRLTNPNDSTLRRIRK